MKKKKEVIQNKRVLVILGDGYLLGQQRANIQVFYSLIKKNINCLFIIGRNEESVEIENHLNKLNIPSTKATFPNLFNKGMKIRDIIVNFKKIIIGNYEVLKIANFYKPTHIHFTNEITLRYFYLFSLFIRKPIIYRLGDEPRQHHIVFILSWRYLFVPIVDHFVCVSEYIKKILIKAGAKEEHVRVIYSYPPTRVNDSNIRLQILEKLKNDYNIIYIGQISHHKGIELLIDTCIDLLPKYNNANLLIIGNYVPNDPYLLSIENKINNSSVSNRIYLLGKIENISELFNISKLHICPSIWEEPLSNTVVEAKKYGLPSVIFNSGGLPEIIKHKVDGYICNEKTQKSLQEGIEYYLSDDTKTMLAGIEAKDSLELLEISEEHFCNKWLKVYENR